jgi:hypothetical protein
MAGMLPIQNIEPVLRFIGQRIPLEKVLKLKHEDEIEEEQKQDEFSLDVSPSRKKEEKGRWTTDELLAAYADQQGECRCYSHYHRTLCCSFFSVCSFCLAFLQVSSPPKLDDQIFIERELSFFDNFILLRSLGDSDHRSREMPPVKVARLKKGFG